MEQVRLAWTGQTILDFLYNHRHDLGAMGVTKIGLFGSYVRGEQKPESDIDLLFTMDNMTFTRWMDVWNFLEDHLRSKIDLVPEKDLRAELRPHVLTEVKYVADL